jgi:hypothetical protein
VTGERDLPGVVRCRAVALDYGRTISTSREDHVLAQKGVDPQAAVPLHQLASRGFRLLLATNASASETRWPALQAAGVHELFAVALISYSLNLRKDDPLFYDLVITAARCPADQVRQSCSVQVISRVVTGSVCPCSMSGRTAFRTSPVSACQVVPRK